VAVLYPWYELKRSFDNGDTEALSRALWRCAANPAEPMPDWVAEAYLEAFRQINEFEVFSWDDVLGKPFDKRTEFNAGKLQPTEYKIYKRVEEERDTGAKTAVSRDSEDSAFSIVGKEFNSSADKVAKVYYRFRKAIKKSEQEIRETEHFYFVLAECEKAVAAGQTRDAALWQEAANYFNVSATEIEEFYNLIERKKSEREQYAEFYKVFE